MVALPVLLPKQSTLVLEEIDALSETAGCVIVVLAEVVHPFASVIVQVKLPAGKLLAVAVVCTGEEFHEYK